MKKVFSFLILSLVAMLFLVAPQPTRAAYTSSICPGDPLSETVRCPESAVGPFMKNVTNTCGNAGNCSLNDIMVVFANVGNFVLRIIASVVLLMYVIGGFKILASHGDSGMVSEGKKMIKTSTFGLLIVMVAYLGVQSLYAILTDTKVNNWAVCDGSNNGAVCATGNTCQEGACLPSGTGTK